MVRPERFELPTTWFVARYSIQLSYGRNKWISDESAEDYTRQRNCKKRIMFIGLCLFFESDHKVPRRIITLKALR